jgi:HEAT repeat protein
MDNQKNYIQDLINGLKSNNKEQKLLSVSALGILREKEHAKVLTDLLASTDNEIVEQVITVLGHMAVRSVKHLVTFLTTQTTNSLPQPSKHFKASTSPMPLTQSYALAPQIFLQPFEKIILIFF